MANPLKAGQLSLLRRSLRLGVDVDHVAGLSPLVPADWLFGLQVPERAQAHRLEPATRVEERHSQGFGDAPHRAALMVQCPGLLLLLRMSVRRWLRRTLRRSTSAAAPPERNLASQLYAVLRLIPTWQARSANGMPWSMCRRISPFRPTGVSRAFGWVCMVCELWGRG